MPKYLGIDYGLERAGVAVTDPDGRLAFPVATLSLGQCGSRRELLNRLAALARERQADAIVLGLPLSEDGAENLMCRQVRNFAARLARRTDRPILFASEYLSSQAASADLRMCGLKGTKARAVLDQQAACLILESFLASRRGADYEAS